MLDFTDFNQQRYAALATERLRKREQQEGAATVDQAVQTQQLARAGPALWPRFRAWLIAVRLRLST